MKKTSAENIIVSEILEKELGVSFSNEELNINNWGHVDNYCEFSPDTIILLECESGQKHPTTNVLKLFPYLEEQDQLHVILIHYFFPENNAPKNRIALCEFMGSKLENFFGIRFQYVRLSCAPEQIPNEIKKHDRRLMQAVFATKDINH